MAKRSGANFGLGRVTCTLCGQPVIGKQTAQLRSDAPTFTPAVRHLEPGDCPPLTELQAVLAPVKLAIMRAQVMLGEREYHAFRDIVARALDWQRQENPSGKAG